ncbi:uncharacterized protein [Cherax quadricarinatus]
MSSGDEEIEEEILEHGEDASLSDSKEELFLPPIVGLQTEETSIVSDLLNLGATADKHGDIANTRPLSLEVRGLLNQSLYLESNDDNAENVFDLLKNKNENFQKEKKLGEEEKMEPSTSYNSLSQHIDHLSKSPTFKSHSESDHISSADASPVSSDWSAEDSKTHSTGSNSEYIEDRSVSEVAVSIPKLTIFSFDSAHKVGSLVKQFSLQNDEPNNKTSEAVSRRPSLPVTLSPAISSEVNSFMSLQNGKQSSLLCEENPSSCTSKDCVSGKIGYFNRQERKDYSCNKGPRKSPKKLGKLSPRVKDSLEKIGACLSRGSSVDTELDFEERKILKSKENLTFEKITKNMSKHLPAIQKENTPFHKNKLKDLSQKMKEKNIISQEKMEDLGDIVLTLSQSSSCSSLRKSKQTSSLSENNCSEKEISQIKASSKLAAEDTCDTEEDVEDMPVDKVQNLMGCIEEDGNICLSEDKYLITHSPHSFTEHSSPEFSKSSEMSPDIGEKVSCFSSKRNFSGSIGERISGSLDISLEENRDAVSKEKINFFSAENLCHSAVGNAPSTESSLLDTCDGKNIKLDCKVDDALKVDSSCASLSCQEKERDVLQESECQSQGDFPPSLENESCDELLNLDLNDHSVDELYCEDFSDASEFVLELRSKSPISAITERTEESGQENEKFNSRQERETDLCSGSSGDLLKRTVDDPNSGSECQSVEQNVPNESAIEPLNEKNFPSLPLNIVNNDSSHFTGTSPVQGGSLVQTQDSLLTSNEPVYPHSSQHSTNAVGQYSSKSGTKAKLPLLNSSLIVDKIEKSATPPLSPTIKTPCGPVRTTLHRNSSRSMHNLTSNHGSVCKSQGLKSRSMSVSSDNLDGNSLRAKSLSPGPIPRQKIKCNIESGCQGSLNRRCVSAIALNENDGQVNLKKNRSFSLNKLNRSRSSSMTSLASSKKLDYSQVPSKVRQYIKDVKDKDIRNSTRSLPCTPARKTKPQVTSQAVVSDETLFRELPHFDDDEMPDDIRKIRDQIFGENIDPKKLENILKMLILERKSRHASDATLAALQLHFDNLSARFAEKENEIDRLRFYKDIHINKGYTLLFKAEEDRRINSGRSSHNTTPPNTPSRSHFASPNISGRRSSYQTTPPNTPNIRSLSPNLSHSNLIKATSTPIADPNLSFAYGSSNSYVFQDSIPGDASRNHRSMESKEISSGYLKDEDGSRDFKNDERNKDLSKERNGDLNNEERSRDLMNEERGSNMKKEETNMGIENRVRIRDLESWETSRDFENEQRNRDKKISSSRDEINLQLWMKDAQTVLKRIKEFALLEGSAALQQSERNIIWHSILDQYWRLSYQFPLLTLLASSHEPGILLQDLGLALQATARRFDLDLVARQHQERGEPVKSDLDKTFCTDDDNGKKGHERIVADGYRKFNPDDSGNYETQKGVGEAREELSHDLDNNIQSAPNKAETHSRLSSKVDDIHKEGSMCTVQYSPKKLWKEQFDLPKDVTKILDTKENRTLKNQQHTDTSKASVLSSDVSNEAHQQNLNKVKETSGITPAYDSDPVMMGCPFSSRPITESIKTSPFNIYSPAHSRESLKTVGPLEKVKLWQASLNDPDMPIATYESSNVSPVPSIVSLHSSQSFDPHVDAVTSLTDHQIIDIQTPNKTGTNLMLDHAASGSSRSVRNKKNDYSQPVHSVDCSSLLPSDRLECDLPKCSWRSNSVTPRLPWERTIKVRDLDSGCPGSEQSTRMSHNASLEQPEQLEMSNFHSGLEAISNGKMASATLAEPQICPPEEHANGNRNVNKSNSKSSVHSHHQDKNSNDNAGASPSSELVNMAFPDFGECQGTDLTVTDTDRKNRTLSASRSSNNSSKNKIDKNYGQSELQSAVQKHRHGRPVSASFSLRDDYCRGDKSRNSDINETAVHERDLYSQDTDSVSEPPYINQSMNSRKMIEKGSRVSKERSKDWRNDHDVAALVGKEQIKRSKELLPVEHGLLKQSNSNKYSAKYISGNNSNLSGTSTSSPASSNIYNNISKLKRDLNVIKSQMMNLTSEIFHSKRRKEELSNTSSNNLSSKVKRRQKPIKALDMSVHSEDSEFDSSITSPDPCQAQQSSKNHVPKSSRLRPATVTKTESRNNTREDFEKHCISPLVNNNFHDSQQNTSMQLTNSSLEELSESVFAISKIGKLPRSTPKNKKSPSKERATTMPSCQLNNKTLNEDMVIKPGDKMRRKLFSEKQTDITTSNIKQPPFDHTSTKHVSVQTEKSDNKVTLIYESVPTAALTHDKLSKTNTDDTLTEHQRSQFAQATDERLLNTTAPVIYIQNYNCGNEASKICSDGDDAHKSKRSDDHCKHRRSGSAHELMVSLDEATTLAERLRLRSESMLSYLNLHFSVHMDQNQS